VEPFRVYWFATVREIGAFFLLIGDNQKFNNVKLEFGCSED